jgi:hypothetical protein
MARTTYPDAMPPQQRRTLRRQSVDLPADLAESLTALAKEAGTNRSTLLYGWFVLGARLAAEGNGNLLPRAVRERHAAPVRRVHVYWPQADDEHARCAAQIRGAGSSPTAVLRAAGYAYVAAGGDPLAMEWPPKSGLYRAA